jgi:hypothetical protein
VLISRVKGRAARVMASYLASSRIADDPPVLGPTWFSDRTFAKARRYRQALIGVNDQFFFREELERAIALHIDRVAKIAVRGRKDGNDDAGFMIVGRFINRFANRKFGHHELPPESPARLSTQIG